MSVPLLHRIGSRCDYIDRSSYKPIATKRSGSRNQPKRCLLAGPEHAISYTWQLASNVAIIYPDSRFFGHLPRTLIDLNDSMSALSFWQHLRMPFGFARRP